VAEPLRHVLAVDEDSSSLQDRRQSHRDREAADLAAKVRGDAGTDPWQLD
jgi:hypothetical protein